MSEMQEGAAAEWLNIWEAAHRTGTVVDFLSWLAKSGYVLAREQPVEPMSADAVWALVAGRSDDADRFLRQRAAGDFDVPCWTCGSLAHGAADCDAVGLVPGAYYLAHQAHTEGLPHNPAECSHCGHTPCCDCSGELPTAETIAEVMRAAAQHPQVNFTEERPGVWKTATPEDGARLDADIDAALASLGTSLADLRAQHDETPTVCAAPECGRTRPRWTMEQSGGAWVCSPKNAMHCGQCCAPGEYLTHYTEVEHEHYEAERATCSRCGRDVLFPLLANLRDKDGGGLACSSRDRENWEACQRAYNPPRES